MSTYSHHVVNDLQQLPLNDLLQATPVFAFLLFLNQVPGAPDQDRSPRKGMESLGWFVYNTP